MSILIHYKTSFHRVAETLGDTSFTSRLDYSKSLLSGFSKNSPKNHWWGLDFISPILVARHWLLFELRMKVQIIILT